MEQYFEDISVATPGFEEFRKEACAFKVGFGLAQTEVGDAGY